VQAKHQFHDDQDRRKLLGVVAGAIASEEVKAFAVKNGFFCFGTIGGHGKDKRSRRL
jgi:hypothetical protein